MEISNDQNGHGPETTLLILMIAFFRGLSMADFDAVTHVMLVLLELSSGVLIIVINWRKAWSIITGKNKKT